jgi:hypothetical protein
MESSQRGAQKYIGNAALLQLRRTDVSLHCGSFAYLLEKWISQIRTEILWRRLEKDLGRSTESGFVGDMINGRRIWTQRPGEN